MHWDKTNKGTYLKLFACLVSVRLLLSVPPEWLAAKSLLGEFLSLSCLFVDLVLFPQRERKSVLQIVSNQRQFVNDKLVSGKLSNC